MRRWLLQQIHISWLVAWLCGGIVIGVIAAAQIPAGSFGEIIWVLLGTSFCCLALWRRQKWLVIVVVAGGLLVGLWRGSVGQHELTVYRHIIGKTLTIRGTVIEDPDVGKHGETVLRLKDIEIDGHRLPGKIWVSAAKNPQIKRSDIVTARGKMSDGFASFSASVFRADIISAARPIPGDVALGVRDDFANHVREGIDEPAVSLGLGYLLGQRRALPSDLDDALRIAGLMHVVVASGYNLTILVRLARRLFVRVSKYLSALAAGGMIVAFVAVTGLSPSMSRAGLIAFLSLGAWYYGRKFHPFVLLPFAAAITLLVEPSFGWNDMGWSLSFAAFAGVMIVAPLSHAYFFGDKKPGLIRQIIGETTAAQLATLPLLIVAFGTMSTVALFANLLILPLVPLAMLLTFATGAAAYIAPLLSGIVGWPTQLLLDYMIFIAKYFANLPWAQLEISMSPIAAIVYYVVLGLVCVWMWRATKFRFGDHNIIE